MMSNSCLTLENITIAYQDKIVLENINATIPSGVLTAIIGPNGAGKSTLLKASLDLVEKKSGVAFFFNEKLDKVRKKVAYIPQRNSIDWDFPATVQDVVLMGLFPHKGLFKRITSKDKEKVHLALQQVDLQDFSSRQISQLSGGQQQRVFIARALVQEPELYLMDEPFAGVDVASESQILAILKSLVSSGKSVVVIHHDLETVSKYFSHILLLHKSIIAQGKTEQVMTQDNLKQAFGSLAPMI